MNYRSKLKVIPIELYQDVSLICDLPDYGLRSGDIATLIDFVPHPQGSEALLNFP